MAQYGWRHTNNHGQNRQNLPTVENIQFILESEVVPLLSATYREVSRPREIPKSSRRRTNRPREEAGATHHRTNRPREEARSSRRRNNPPRERTNTTHRRNNRPRATGNSQENQQNPETSTRELYRQRERDSLLCREIYPANREPNNKGLPKWLTWLSVFGVGKYKSGRGCVLLINNIFLQPANREFERLGAHVDVHYVNRCFRNTLNYHITIHEEVQSRDWFRILDGFQRTCREKKASCSIVIVSSQGYHSDSTIMLTDQVLVHMYQDLVCLFQENRCPWLAGKPKLFFFNGFSPLVNESRMEMIRRRNGGQSLDSCKDTLIGVSSLPNQFGYRNMDTGSYYIKDLMETFMDHRGQDLVAILDRVKSRMNLADFNRQRNFNARSRQTPYYTSFGFDKKFYFGRAPRRNSQSRCTIS